MCLRGGDNSPRVITEGCLAQEPQAVGIVGRRNLELEGRAFHVMNAVEWEMWGAEWS